MAKYSAQGLADAIEWEGGIYAALEYGIKPDDIEDEELRSLWRDLYDMFTEFDLQVQKIQNALPEVE